MSIRSIEENSEIIAYYRVLVLLADISKYILSRNNTNYFYETHKTFSIDKEKYH